MKFQKSIIATAILLASANFAVAADLSWKDPTDFDFDHQYEYNGPAQGMYFQTTDTTDRLDNDKIVSVSGNPNATLGQHTTSIFEATKANTSVHNSGTMYVIGNGTFSQAMGGYGENVQVVNEKNGVIYVDGTGSPLIDGYEGVEGYPFRVKGISLDGATGINDGTIIVKNAVAMAANTSNDKVQNMTNRGTIRVYEGGVGIGSIKTSSVIENTDGGSIIVSNGGTGILVDALTGSTPDDKHTKTINNTANIIALDEDSVAIDASASIAEVAVNLSGQSHVVGKVVLSEDTSNLKASNLSQAESIDLVNGAKTVTIENSDLTINQKYGALTIGTLTTSEGTSHFKLSEVGTADAPVLTIVDLAEEANVDYGYTGTVSDALQKGEVSSKDLLDNIQVEGKSAEKASMDQGLMGDAGYVDETGFHATRTNDLLRSAQDLAITNALMWRSQLTNLTDRMGTLRTTPNAAGVWARYNNGRLDGLGIEHDYNTVELGVDKRIADNVTIGFSFDYTKGDTDLTAGTSDNNTYTVGFYGSYFNESGCFLDSMLKIGRIDADYDLRTSAGKESADYMLTGAIFGIETGHRWNIQNYFIEPQVQLTYSHLRAENYTSSIGRDVKFDDMSSLIGRVGVMAGMQFAENRGAAYVKASYNHDFLGDVEGNYEYNGAVRTFDDELDDNWGEVSLGGSYQVTDSVNTFVDVGTGFGGDIDQKWRVNLGARYVF